MKKITSIIALGLALMALSCNKASLDQINEISDHYTVPATAQVMKAVEATSTWSLDRRYFDLSFSGEMSSIFTTTLVGYDALLTPGQYVVGADAIGNAIAANTKVNGTAVSKGYVYVTKKANNYVVTGVFPVEGSEDAVFTWEGTLPFVADPDPLELNVLQQAQKNQGLVTLQLATAEFTSEFDMTTYQNVLKGDGKYLALDLYSEDGYLHDGEYKACAVGGVVNAGEFGIGYDGVMDYGEWGQFPFENWGTCLWTVTPEGNNTAEKITGGLVTVSSEEVGDETIWTIYWGEEYPKELLFKGAIKALTKPKPVLKDPDYLFTEKITAGDVEKHAITITDKDENIVAYLELLMASGETNYEGSYPSTSYASQAGQMCDGYDGGSYGTYTWPAGGSYYVEDGQEKRLYANSATVVVTKIAEGAYQFTCEFFDYAAAGPDYVPVGGGDFDGVVLTQFCGLTNYYVLYGEQAPIIGVDLATEDVVVTPGGWGNTYSGSGNYLKLEFGTADGNIATGTYTACEVGGTVGPTEFGIGYDGYFGASGTAWYTVAETNTYEYVVDGTLTIDKDGDNYVIILKSSVVNAKYVGPLE